MASGTLGKIHLQLRRLNNERNNPSQTGPGLAAPENATVTMVIPSGCSRVLFSFASDDHDVAGPTLTHPFAMLSDEDRYGMSCLSAASKVLIFAPSNAFPM